MLSPLHPELQRSLFCSGVKGKSVPLWKLLSHPVPKPAAPLLSSTGLFFEDCLPGLSSASTTAYPFLPLKTKDILAAHPTHRQAEFILQKAPS